MSSIADPLNLNQYKNAYEAFDAHRRPNPDGSFNINGKVRAAIVDNMEKRGKLKTTYHGKVEDFPKKGVVWK